MRTFCGLLISITAAVCLMGIARAQDNRQDDSIIVSARPPVDGPAARKLVARMAVPVGGQLARFHVPVCPMVSGIPDPYAQRVVARIRQVASDVHAPVGPPGCAPNFFLVVVDDGRAFAEAMGKADPAIFTGVSGLEQKRLLTDPGAVRSWSATRRLDANGDRSPTAPLPGAGSDARDQNANPRVGGAVNRVLVDKVSIINPGVQQAITSSYVVIDTAAVLGRGLMQIADYAAMRGLAMTGTSRLDGNEDTILTLFDPDGGGHKGGLTKLDRAYLAGLYHGTGDRDIYGQRSGIARRIVKAGRGDAQ